MSYYYRGRSTHTLPAWVAGNSPSAYDIADMIDNAGRFRPYWTIVITGVPSEVSPDTNFEGYDEEGKEIWRWHSGEIATRSFFKVGSALEYDLVEMCNELGYGDAETMDDVISILRGQLYTGEEGQTPPWEIDADLVASYITQAEGVSWTDVTEIATIDKEY